MTIFLIDDERTFKDAREDVVVAQSSYEAADLAEKLDSIEELWLDFFLIGSDDTGEFIKYLTERKDQGRELEVKKVFIHTSAWMMVPLMRMRLEQLGITNISEVNALDYFVRV